MLTHGLKASQQLGVTNHTRHWMLVLFLLCRHTHSLCHPAPCAARYAKLSDKELLARLLHVCQVGAACEHVRLERIQVVCT